MAQARGPCIDEGWFGTDAPLGSPWVLTQQKPGQTEFELVLIIGPHSIDRSRQPVGARRLYYRRALAKSMWIDTAETRYTEVEIAFDRSFTPNMRGPTFCDERIKAIVCADERSKVCVRNPAKRSTARWSWRIMMTLDSIAAWAGLEWVVLSGSDDVCAAHVISIKEVENVGISQPIFPRKKVTTAALAMPSANIPAHVASDPAYARSMADYIRLMSSPQYASNGAMSRSHFWKKFKRGSVLRVKRPGPTMPGQPEEQFGYITLVGVVSDNKPNVSPIGGYIPGVTSSLAKAKYSLVLLRPNDNAVFGPAWDAGMGNLKEVEALIGGNTMYLWVTDRGEDGVRVSKPMFEEKGIRVEVDASQWPIPENCSQAYAEVLANNDIRVLPVYDINDVRVHPSRVAAVLPRSLVEVTYRMFYHSIQAKGPNGEPIVKQALTGELEQIAILENAPPAPANPFSAATRVRQANAIQNTGGFVTTQTGGGHAGALHTFGQPPPSSFRASHLAGGGGQASAHAGNNQPSTAGAAATAHLAGGGGQPPAHAGNNQSSTAGAAATAHLAGGGGQPSAHAANNQSSTAGGAATAQQPHQNRHMLMQQSGTSQQSPQPSNSAAGGSDPFSAVNGSEVSNQSPARGAAAGGRPSSTNPGFFGRQQSPFTAANVNHHAPVAGPPQLNDRMMMQQRATAFMSAQRPNSRGGRSSPYLMQGLSPADGNDGSFSVQHPRTAGGAFQNNSSYSQRGDVAVSQDTRLSPTRGASDYLFQPAFIIQLTFVGHLSAPSQVTSRAPGPAFPGDRAYLEQHEAVPPSQNRRDSVNGKHTTRSPAAAFQHQGRPVLASHYAVHSNDGGHEPSPGPSSDYSTQPLFGADLRGGPGLSRVDEEISPPPRAPWSETEVERITSYYNRPPIRNDPPTPPVPSQWALTNGRPREGNAPPFPFGQGQRHAPLESAPPGHPFHLPPWTASPSPPVPTASDGRQPSLNGPRPIVPIALVPTTANSTSVDGSDTVYQPRTPEPRQSGRTFVASPYLRSPRTPTPASGRRSVRPGHSLGLPDPRVDSPLPFSTRSRLSPAMAPALTWDAGQGRPPSTPFRGEQLTFGTAPSITLPLAPPSITDTSGEDGDVLPATCDPALLGGSSDGVMVPAATHGAAGTAPLVDDIGLGMYNTTTPPPPLDLASPFLANKPYEAGAFRPVYGAPTPYDNGEEGSMVSSFALEGPESAELWGPMYGGAAQSLFVPASPVWGERDSTESSDTADETALEAYKRRRAEVALGKRKSNYEDDDAVARRTKRLVQSDDTSDDGHEGGGEIRRGRGKA
ncbi:hypothetical protein DFH09DRAFT_1105257 [Mycena vulgaris]|nr:hypothetical protein DFH09DRAFT_1105257 [Mycena vulgaris]